MSFRKIDVSAETRRAAPGGGEPELSWVPINALVINEAYQRPIEKRGWVSIRKIADNFDWGRFSPLLVSRQPDGTFAVIDGQHRAHAAAMCGLERVPALVVDLSEREQASAFSWVNGTVTALTPLQVYRAALAAMEPWALQCDAAVTRAGCQLMTWNANAAAKKPGQVFCIGFIRSMIDAGHAETLVAVLAGLRGSHNGQEAYFYAAQPLKALSSAAVELGVRREEVISGFLADHDLVAVESHVHKLRSREEYRSQSFAALLASSLKVLMRQWQASGKAAAE